MPLTKLPNGDYIDITQAEILSVTISSGTYPEPYWTVVIVPKSGVTMNVECTDKAAAEAFRDEFARMVEAAARRYVLIPEDRGTDLTCIIPADSGPPIVGTRYRLKEQINLELPESP